MKDNISIIFATLIGTFLIVILPLFSILDRQDSMSYNVVLTQTTKFVDDVRNKGFIDKESYYNYIAGLASTSNTYKVNIEAYRKTLIHATDEYGKIIENKYVEEIELYNTKDILEVIESEETVYDVETGKKSNIYLFDENDEIYVKVYNTNITAGSIIYKLIAGQANTEVINISYGGAINKVNWQLYDKLIESTKREPEVILTVPTNADGDSNIMKLIQAGTWEDVDCNDVNLSQEERSYCEGTNISTSSKGYTYLYDLTQTKNKTIKLSVELKELETINIGVDEKTNEEIYVRLDEINKELFDKSKAYIMEKYLRLNGMFAIKNIELREDRNYYFFDITLTDIRMSSIDYISTIASVTILPGLGKDKDGTLSLGAESVEIEIKDEMSVTNVAISGPYNWKKIFKSNVIEDAIMNSGVVYTDQEIAFLISYTGIVQETEDILNAIKEHLKVYEFGIDHSNIELYTIENFEKQYGNKYTAHLHTSTTSHVIVKFAYKEESDEDQAQAMSYIQLDDAWIETNLEDPYIDNPEAGRFAEGAESTKYKVVIDNTPPVSPKITVTGTLGNNGWYISDVEVGLKKSETDADGSGVYKNYIELSGAKNVAKREYTDTPINVNVDGKTNISAYAIDYVNNASEVDELTINVDKTAPTAPSIKLTGTSGTNGWYTSNVVINVTPGKDDTSKVASTVIQISKGGKVSTIETTKYTLEEDGKYTVTAITTDNAGNKTSKTTSVNIDKATPPKATISVISGVKNTSDNEWYASDVVLKISVEDTAPVSGIANTKYKISGPSPVQVTEIDSVNQEITITENGVHTITVYTYTNAGLTNTMTYTVKIDKDKPNIPLIKLNGKLGNNNWYTSDVVASFESTGDVGPSNETQYYIYNISNSEDNIKLNKGGTITFNTEGEYTLTVYAIDVAGNMSEAKADIKIDKTAPTPAEFVITGTKGLDDWYTSDISISYSGQEDDISKIDKVTLSHTEITQNTGGILVTLTTTDKAGHSVTLEKNIKVDKTLPTTPTIKLDEPTGIGVIGVNMYNKNVNVQVTPGVDENLLKTTYKVTADSESTVIIPETEGTNFTVTTEGIQTITVRTYDITGRYSEETAVIDINKELPEAPVVSKINLTSVENNTTQTVKGADGNVTLTLKNLTYGNEIKIQYINQETYEIYEVSTIYNGTSEVFATLPSKGKYSIVVTQTNMYGSTSATSSGLYYYEY